MKTASSSLLAILLLLVGCNTLKDTQVNVASGNYDYAIRTAVENLRKSRIKKKSVEYIRLMEEAFAKAVDRDLRTISRMQKELNGQSLEEIYRAYARLHDRQELIRPLLPLYFPDSGREARFAFQNYDDALIASKLDLSEHIYEKAKSLLKAGDKIDARVAYENFSYLDELNPGYKDTRQLINEARYKGTDFVYVRILNHTDLALPDTLERDLLEIDTYGINKPWSVYHNSQIENIEYDYEMIVSVRDIHISPERIHEKELVQEKQIKDGYIYALDENGNVKKDDNGNDIKRDRFITVRSRIQEFTQFKSSKIVADAEYRTFNDEQVISSFPLISELKFEHHFCTHNGDQRALDDRYNTLLSKSLVPFPSDEQMIYDTGEGLKDHLKDIIVAQRF